MLFTFWRPTALPHRETLHVFVTPSLHLSPFVGHLCQFWLTSYWFGTGYVPIPFFIALIVHTLCNLSVRLTHFSFQAYHHPPEPNWHPESGDSTLLECQCQNKFIMECRTLSLRNRLLWFVPILLGSVPSIEL